MAQITATTRKQSERLLEIGVDPDTSDMVWTHFETGDADCYRLDVMDEYAYELSSLKPIPAWSLSALLALMPKEIYGDDDDELYYLSLAQEMPLTDEYVVAYKMAWSITLHILFSEKDRNPITACMKFIEQLVARGYRLNCIKSEETA